MKKCSIRAHTNARTHTHTHTHARTHARIHTHARTHAHTHNWQHKHFASYRNFLVGATLCVRVVNTVLLNELHVLCTRDFLERGRLEDFTQLKHFFERKEIVVGWFKENNWLHPLLGDLVVRPLRPACVSSELSAPHYSSECVSGLVQRYALSASFVCCFACFRNPPCLFRALSAAGHVNQVFAAPVCL